MLWARVYIVIKYFMVDNNGNISSLVGVIHTLVIINLIELINTSLSNATCVLNNVVADNTSMAY